MVKIHVRAVGPAVAPAPVADQPPIDYVHLFRMTLGDHNLEHEVLQLFDRQIELLLARMEQTEAAGVATLAHTLKGSARGIGAWEVARAAEAVEIAVAEGADIAEAIARLRTAAAAVRAVIAPIMRENRRLR